MWSLRLMESCGKNRKSKKPRRLFNSLRAEPVIHGSLVLAQDNLNKTGLKKQVEICSRAM
jgi:hypothetical protein